MRRILRRRVGTLHGAAERAERLHESYLDEAFADMTGNRLPPEIEHAAREVERATFVPCAHLGPYLSYVLYPPELIVYFDATRAARPPVAQWAGGGGTGGRAAIWRRFGHWRTARA